MIQRSAIGSRLVTQITGMHTKCRLLHVVYLIYCFCQLSILATDLPTCVGHKCIWLHCNTRELFHIYGDQIVEKSA